MSAAAGSVHAFLIGTGPDGTGRRLAEVLGFEDLRIEAVHDFVQWCFPLPEASRAVPDAPVLTPAEARAIRADPRARAGLAAALTRMQRFYADTDLWLAAHDHNHLRISRILAAVRDLLGPAEAEAFHDFILARNAEAGGPINAASLGFWARAAARG